MENQNNEVKINITREDNEKYYNSLTEDEKYVMHLDTYRALRNQKLKKTDEFNG